MSMNDRLQQSFDRAQRQYDRQMPPEDTRIECPECEGEGTIPTSNCCDQEIQNGMCMECGKHCKESVCPTCKGDGVVEPPPREEREHDE